MRKSILLDFALGQNGDLSTPLPQRPQKEIDEKNDKLETFFNTLSEHQKRLFLELEDVQSCEMSHDTVYLYIRGFRTGVKMIMELFEEEHRLF